MQWDEMSRRTQSMDAPNGLGLDAGIQLRLHQDHVMGSSQVQPRGTMPSPHANKEDAC